jgi:alkaline phosphatase
MRAIAIAVVLGACAGANAPMGGEVDARAVDAAGEVARPPAVIVMIGDGMGAGQREAASRERFGAPGMLEMERIAVRGEVRTGGPSGITDSAAAATVMATGVYTYNGNIGVDRGENAVETVVERARDRGWATGVVSTAALPHATPGAFTAHVDSRAEMRAIAEQQVGAVRPDVMLGGGAMYFDGLALDEWEVVETGEEMRVAAESATRLFGAFAPEHMTYVRERASDSNEPMLDEMAMAALAVLDRDPDGFFVMIEGGRIDMASHGNDLPNTVGETLAFDDTVAEVVAWAEARGNTTVIVTADHECGGLQVVDYPQVTWRWGNHTNARVAVYGAGPGTEVLDGALVDHRWIYEIARARVDGDAFVEPGRAPVPDGEFADLRHRVVEQSAPSGFGAGFNQLDALYLDATDDGLYLGVEGVFQWDANAVELWIDVDFGAATGPAGLAGALADGTGSIDAVIAHSSVAAPAVPGFGVDLVLVSAGGADPHVEELHDDAGLRGVRAPYGAAADLGWLGAAINFGAVRTAGAPLAATPAQGMEVFVPWSALYPTGRPPGARIAVAAVLVNDDGGYTSNQALPPFDAGSANPGRTLTALPGVAVYDIDHADVAPVVLR